MDTRGKKRARVQADTSSGPSNQDVVHWPSRDTIRNWDAATITEWLLKHPCKPFDGQAQDLAKWRRAGVNGPSFIRLGAKRLQAAPLQLSPAAAMRIADLSEEVQVYWDATPPISEEVARVTKRKYSILQEKLTGIFSIYLISSR